MKTLLSFISSVLTFIFGFWLDNQFINWCVSHLSNPHGDLALLVKIGLWVVTFSTTICLSFWLGIMIGGLIYTILDIKK